MLELFANILTPIQGSLTRLSVWVHGLFVLAALTLVRVTNVVLDANYAASYYPVPFAVGQTAFSGEKLKTYYAHMIEQNSLDVYWRTQFVDFAFIAAVFAAGLVVSLFLARLHSQTSAFYKTSLAAAVLIPLGATFDILENLTSFVMLSQALTFSNWLAVVYSSFAVLKFSAIGAGYLLWLVSALGLVIKILERRRKGHIAA